MRSKYIIERFYLTEDGEQNLIGTYSTIATSHKQALNNIRFRCGVRPFDDGHGNDEIVIWRLRGAKKEITFQSAPIYALEKTEGGAK